MKFLQGLNALWETAISIIPLTAILAAIQMLIFKKPLHSVRDFTIGFLLSVIGLHLFLKGTTMSLIPLGDSVGRNFVSINKKWIILVIGFAIGYAATLVEPGLQALALEIEELSAGAIPSKVLINGVAIGFGGGMVIGLLKILLNLPYVKVLTPLLLIVIILSIFAPEPFDALAFDAASATTGPVNIPINMALAIGLASAIEGIDPLLSGFGIVGLTSIGTMVSVMLLGILSKF